MTEVQNVILNIFKEVDKLCKENDIDYYAIGGTCLGAVRHKGFIPWDDDLDIAIPIENYNRFFELAKQRLPEWLKVRTGMELKKYPLLFGKVYDARTTFIENWEIPYKNTYKGIYVDVMPLGGVPDDGDARQKFLEKIRFLSRFNKVRRGMPGSFKRRLIECLLFPTNLFLPQYYYLKKINKLYNQFPFCSSKYTGYVWHENIVEKKEQHLIFPVEYFGVPIYLPFEDTYIKCPKKYDAYLTQQFGDYMTLPPISEQRIHSVGGIIDCRRPFEEYQKDSSWRNINDNDKD